MDNTVREMLEFINENDVKFIRLGFCDPFGIHKNISIMSNELADAFENGIALSADSIRGFGQGENSTLLLFPDPRTLTVLPWRPGPGRVVRFYCYIKDANGNDFFADSRRILKESIKQLQKDGISCKIGTDCEFYLFKTDENGDPTYNTLDFAGYCDIAPLDKGENIRREICLNLEEMGLEPKCSHHEKGPGQNEIDFIYSDALSAADNFLTFKSVVKAISARNGLYASFMPKPLEDEAGSGLRLNIEIASSGLSGAQADSFAAGIAQKAEEITLLLNPIPNSYSRLDNFWTGVKPYVKVAKSTNNGISIELRSSDCTINPYIAFALILSAGRHGVKNKLSLNDIKPAFPKKISEAIDSFEKSEFALEILGKQLLNCIVSEKRAEDNDYNTAKDKEIYTAKKYFNIY